MRVLWYVPVPFPAVRERLGLPPADGGWWLESLFAELKSRSDIAFGVVWVARNVPKRTAFEHEGVAYYCLPERFGTSGMARRCRALMGLAGLYRGDVAAVVNACREAAVDFDPDLLHFHGSEKPYGLVAETMDRPAVLSLQGILTEYVKAYFGRLPLGQRLALPGVCIGYADMKRRAGIERRVFRACDHFFGRTDWDRGVQQALNPGGRYHHVSEILRPVFYDSQWAPVVEDGAPVFTTTSCLPYKGTDTLLDAMAILRRSRPNLRLRIGGNIPRSGFGGFLRRRVAKLGLENAVDFMGWLSGGELTSELTRASVFVLPSFAENSPNSLAEAQIVGTPVVAADVGGVPSMVTDGTTGLLFEAGNAPMLARQIQRMLEDRELARQCSEQGRTAARIRHDREEIVTSVLQAYGEITLQRPLNRRRRADRCQVHAEPAVTDLVERKVCPVCGSDDGTVCFETWDDRYGHPGRFPVRECRCCGSFYLGRCIARESLGELYRRYYPTVEVARGRPRFSATRLFAARLLNIAPLGTGFEFAGPRVLDVGAGTGQSRDVVERSGGSWTALEIDTKRVEALNKLGMKCLQGDVETLAGSHRGTFDVILASQVIEHAFSPGSFLESCRSLLKPGGRLLIATPNADSRYRRRHGPNWINWHSPYHVVLFSRRGLRTAAKRHGFVVSSMRTATPATWWLRQRTHRRPPPGEKGEWTNRRISKAGLAGAGLVCRAGDLLRGNGDMIMAVLTKPEEGK